MKKLILLLSLISTLQVSFAQELYCKTFGNSKNTPLLFLHGGPGYNCSGFEVTIAKELAEKGFFVIVYDRRGEGRSIDTNSKFSYQESFDDINNILKKYQIKKVNLLGHSFGGVLATLFTEKYPLEVKSIILIGAPVSLQETFKTILSTSKKIYIEKDDKTNLKYINMIEKMDPSSIEYASYCFSHAMQNGFYYPKRMSDEAKAIYSMATKNDTFKYVSQITLEGPLGFLKNENYTSANLTKNLEKLVANKTKIYGLFGKDDGLYSVEQVTHLQNIIGIDNLKYFENCSHNVFIDQQKLFIESLTAWLK